MSTDWGQRTPDAGRSVSGRLARGRGVRGDVGWSGGPRVGGGGERDAGLLQPDGQFGRRRRRKRRRWGGPLYGERK